ncbi:unnamed protein product [Brassica rapa]|uniref:Uncharacterized protein n=1 Tax=Brassica campestris TaxID=3711 RepID=A0A8D9GDT0_BRACM|nr:unnamed protein product [Brassica rapa]
MENRPCGLVSLEHPQQYTPIKIFKKAWLVVVIEFVFKPVAPDSPSATPVVISVVAEFQIEKARSLQWWALVW